MSLLKKLLLLFLGIIIIGTATAFLGYQYIASTLPEIHTLKDYKPLLVSQVYDRKNKKVGEYYRERRILIPYKEIPKDLIHAFMAAEDDKFFEHHGINFQAIMRAALANMQAGRSVQGGSTITQQVVKTLLLTDERTLIRKIREAILSWKIEESLSKEDIMYLYLNQIFFGQRAYGIEAAAETYFRKPVKKLKLSEMAILAGLPQAPSRYSPVINPTRAKERQTYVLRRMAEVGFVTKDAAEKAIKEPVKVYVSEKFDEMAPFYIETLRQILISQIGEKAVLDEGIKVYTSLDLEKQLAAQKAVENGLRELDKRQGFRGALTHLSSPEEIEKYIAAHRKKLISESTPERTILPTGEFAEIYLPNIGRRKQLSIKDQQLAKKDPSQKIPPYISLNKIIEGVVTEVNDAQGYVFVQCPEMLGAIDFQTMKWARKPNMEKRYDQDLIRKPSDALKVGDVIQVRLVNEQFQLTSPNKKEKPASFPDRVALLLEQEPIVEGSLVSLDQQTEELLALVGGFNYKKNEFNRALQAARQTGSSFKALVYAAALDHGYTPSTPIMDTPIVFEQKDMDEGQEDIKIWKPSNHGREYNGDITFRNALVRSLNIPTVKIIEDIGVTYSIDYAHRLGIFSPLNPDFTMALGSSSVTLYEMTKAFSVLGRLGKRIKPIIIHKVLDRENKQILGTTSLDIRYKNEIQPIEEDFEARRKIYFESKTARAANPDTNTDGDSSEEAAQTDSKKPVKDEMFFFPNEEQVIRPQTAYLITSLLKGTVEDAHGTGGKARALGREVAGKTGTSNGYVDAWFLGFTAQISTGVWVGFDKERTIGKGEVGGRAALPIWVEYMVKAHDDLPPANIPVPDGITFVSIDADTGKLASSKSKTVIRQAFREGTEPSQVSNKEEETSDFLKQDLTE